MLSMRATLRRRSGTIGCWDELTMTYRLACADFTFPLLPHDLALRLISMLEFEGVDIGLFEGRSHLWPSREFADPERSGLGLREKLDDLSLLAADVFLQMD